MNYYERHLGDYARDAGHLSMLEHGAYTLLLDRYYTTEQPIPAGQAHRVCRARTKEERAAVDAVLTEFFSLVDDKWHNGRADREITKMQAKVKAAQENGKRGGRPKRTDKEPTGFPLGSVLETQEKALQSPVTSHQTPELKANTGQPSHHIDARDERDSFPPPVLREDTPPTPVTLLDVPDVSPDFAGSVCAAIKAAGMSNVNPADPSFRTLLAAGATAEEFAAAAPVAMQNANGSPWRYMLSIVSDQRKRAKALSESIAQGVVPPLRQAFPIPPAANRQEALEASNLAVGRRWAARMRREAAEEQASAQGAKA